ncbi:MAG: PAS domain S-box protein [Planctomycetota bacterium]|nr:PAS domain S-box protein [Planctomycetota bacterium]
MSSKPDPHFLDLFDVRRLATSRKASLDIPIQLGFLLLATLIAVGTWTGYQHTQSLYASQEFVAHTHQVISQLRGVQGTLMEEESASRAFVISGDERHFESFAHARDLVPVQLDALSSTVFQNDGQLERMGRLRPLIVDREAFIDVTVGHMRSGDAEEAVRRVRTGEGWRLMDQVHALMDEMEATELALLSSRQAEAHVSYQKAQTTGIAIGVAAFVLVVAVYNWLRRYDRLRRVAAREVNDAKKRFEVALASIGDAVLVTDPAGRVAYANAGCRTILGIDLDDIGKVLDEKVTFVTESTGNPLESVLNFVRKDGHVHRVGRDAAVRRSDGTIIPVDITAAALHSENDEAQGVVLVVLDVSEQRERERQLARSNERFQSLVLATSQIVWTTDAAGYVRDDSPGWRQLTGQTYEQWKGHGWLDALHPDDRQRVLHGWQLAVAEKRPFSVEYRLRMANGTYRWSMVRAVPVLDPDGTVREWVGMNYDIQQRKEAEEAQLNANRRKDEFIALLAHELRNPLAPLRNGIEVLKHGDRDQEERAVEMMDRQVQHMVRLIDDLLELSRITQGKLELRLEHFDMRDMLRQSVDGMSPSLAGKQQQLSMSLPRAPMWIEGDPVRLTQVVTNLLNNAVKYSGEHAHIWLSAEREGMNHRISVRDTGQGIPTELRTRIWDLFLQGDGRVERVAGGLGIGLTLVKRIVEMHNGSVDVLSEGLGSGSEFIVRIPAAKTSVIDVAAPTIVSSPEPRPLRILVIDDNEDSAESLSMLLRIGGHSVRAAFSGDAGLQEFNRFDPELVLCDIRMPDMSGYEVARRLRAQPEGKKAVLVALTGFGSESDRESSLRAGFDRHLVKPVDPDRLVETLHLAAERPVSSK